MDGDHGPAEPLLNGRGQRGGSKGASAFLGGLAALLGLGLLVGGGYMLVTTAGSPPPARPSAKPPPPPPPKEPEPRLDDETRDYFGQVDAIMKAREIELQALADAVTLQGQSNLAVESAMAITVRRRESTQRAIEELMKIQPPGQAYKVHELYQKLLRDDLAITDQTVAALRKGDAERATQYARARDQRTQETLEAIRAEVKAIGER